MAKKAEAVVPQHKKVLVTALEPNPWNPNKMPGRLLVKLTKNIEETLKKGKSIPPVVVRPHPTDKGRYQIIDGFHRYKSFKQLKVPDIDVFVMDVDDATAKLLTMNLNYLRGDKDPEKYTTLVSDLLEGGMTLDDLSALLPEDEADISDLITTFGDGEAIRQLIAAQDAAGVRDTVKDLNEDNVFVELRYNVSVTQAKVIKRELDRISARLAGNNTEGRALEFMAVQSSQSELPADMIGPEPKPPAPKKNGKLKDKMSDRLKELRKGVA